jgi:ubiquinone/menaquinone biosynthesis C-methylase UbiE
MGFALRHVTDLREAFAEFRRVSNQAARWSCSRSAHRHRDRSLVRLYLGRFAPLAAAPGG